MISYDIASDERRARLAKLLLDYGRRVQYSVFECQIDEKSYLELKEKVEQIVDMTEDSVRFYSLCRRCELNVAISGKGTVTDDPDLYIV